MAAEHSGSEIRPRELRVDRLLGREVFTRNGRRAGRLEEFRAEKHGTAWVVTEFVIGMAGLFERLGVGVKLLFGHLGGGYVARADQIDLSDIDKPRLTCSIEELRKL